MEQYNMVTYSLLLYNSLILIDSSLQKYNLLTEEAVAAGMAMVVTKSRDKTDNSYATTNPASAYTGLNNNIANRKGTNLLLSHSLILTLLLTHTHSLH